MSQTPDLQLRWLIYRNSEEKYPFSLFIEEKPGTFVSLKTKEKWPGPGKNVFCKFEGMVTSKDIPRAELIEQCPIFSLRRYGKRLTVVLNRPRNKRCWFIFIQKEYKSHPGTFYTQVFWITQASSIAERRGAYIPSVKQVDYKILIDKNERYAYRFGAIPAERAILPSGDYGLSHQGKVIAVVERKTKDNFFHELAHLDVLRAKLQELDKFVYKAVVFEGSYGDFVSPQNKFYSGAFVARVLADLYAEFPGIQFVFFKGRKSANQWVFYYFQQVYARTIGN